MPQLLILVLWALVQLSCTSIEDIQAERHAELLEIYPLQLTTRANVAEKWNPIKPDLSRERPNLGWELAKEPFIANRLSAVEKDSGKAVVTFDRYWGPDGVMSLCRIWYFFDEDDKLIDLEWNYVSD